MALAKVDSITRGDLGANLSTPQTRGLVYNGQQVEMVFVTKLTGDTTGSIDLDAVRRPREVFLAVIDDDAGALIAEKEVAAVAFTHTDNDTIALSGLGDWTTALLFICGRSYDFAASS